MAELYSAYSGDLQGSTQIVENEQKDFLVKYPRGDGSSFKVLFRSKPNPIGFVIRKGR